MSVAVDPVTIESKLPEYQSPLRWYVVRSLHRRENQAFTQLQAQTFDVFMPRVACTVRHARKLRNVIAPAFPGYLFVRLDLASDRWWSINSTFGVQRMIMGAEGPMPVPRGLVESLIALNDERGLTRFDQLLKLDQPVRVISGPFTNVLGRLVEMNANGRVRVLLEIMSGQVETTMARSALQAA